jgi:hypothetical protein
VPRPGARDARDRSGTGSRTAPPVCPPSGTCGRAASTPRGPVRAPELGPPSCRKHRAAPRRAVQAPALRARDSAIDRAPVGNRRNRKSSRAPPRRSRPAARYPSAPKPPGSPRAARARVRARAGNQRSRCARAAASASRGRRKLRAGGSCQFKTQSATESTER